MAGQQWADWLFMLGLLGTGLALIVGNGIRMAAVTGTVLRGAMYLDAIAVSLASASWTPVT